VVHPPRRVEGTDAVYMAHNSFRSLGTIIPNPKCYQSARGEIIHRMDFVWGKPANTMVMMALAQGRGMFIIMEGGEAGDVCLFSQIKGDFVSCTQEMHVQPVKDISGMGNIFSKASFFLNLLK
jgi:hypothetical protein